MANSSVTRWKSIAEEAGKKYGINPALLLADIEQESGGDPNSVSSAGARGLTQFIPTTAAAYGVKFGSGQAEVRSQIFGQAAYLSRLGAASNPKYALEGYLGAHNAEGQAYANSVLGKVKEYEPGSGADGLGLPGEKLFDEAGNAISNTLLSGPLQGGGPFGKGAVGELGLEGAGNPLEEFSKIGKALVSPSTWLRLAEGVGGIVLFFVGLKTLTRGTTGATVITQQSRSVKGVGVKAGRVVAGVGK